MPHQGCEKELTLRGESDEEAPTVGGVRGVQPSPESFLFPLRHETSRFMYYPRFMCGRG
jgi:hypothetical protein